MPEVAEIRFEVGQVYGADLLCSEIKDGNVRFVAIGASSDRKEYSGKIEERVFVGCVIARPALSAIVETVHIDMGKWGFRINANECDKVL